VNATETPLQTRNACGSAWVRLIVLSAFAGMLAAILLPIHVR
jgi:hypothetical protein